MGIIYYYSIVSKMNFHGILSFINYVNFHKVDMTIVALGVKRYNI